MIARAARVLIVAAVVVGGGVLVAGAAGAHTEVQRSTPGPGTEVDGVVEQVELVFLDPVQEPVEIVVSSLDGTPVAGLGPTRLGEDRRTARVRFDPLRDVGPVLVEYRFVAEDGAGQEGSYTFRYQGGAPPPPSVEDPPGVGTAGLVGLVGFVVFAVAAGVMARVRAASASDA